MGISRKFRGLVCLWLAPLLPTVYRLPQHMKAMVIHPPRAAPGSWLVTCPDTCGGWRWVHLFFDIPALRRWSLRCSALLHNKWSQWLALKEQDAVEVGVCDFWLQDLRATVALAAVSSLLTLGPHGEELKVPASGWHGLWVNVHPRGLWLHLAPSVALNYRPSWHPACRLRDTQARATKPSCSQIHDPKKTLR